MSGLAKFFFGGIVGAVIGILMSPKRAQKVREALLGGGAAGGSRHLAAPAPSDVLSAEAVEVAPQPLPVEHMIPEPPVPEQPMPELITPESVPAEDLVEPPHPPVPPAPPEEEAAEEVKVAEAPMMAEAPEFAEVPEMPEAAPLATAYSPPPSPEAIVEAQEQPIWEPATAPLEPELAPESPGFEAADLDEELIGATTVEIEEPTTAGGLEPLQEPAAEQPEEGGVVAEAVPAEQAVGESIGEAEPEAGMAGTAAEAPEHAEAAAEVPAPVHSPADLKARIEETRRRIRRELAHPFSGEPEEAAASSDIFSEQQAPVFAAPEPESLADLAPAASELEEAEDEVPLAEPPGFPAFAEPLPAFADEAARAYEQAEVARTLEEPEAEATAGTPELIEAEPEAGPDVPAPSAGDFEPVAEPGPPAEHRDASEPPVDLVAISVDVDDESADEPAAVTEDQGEDTGFEQDLAPELVAALPGGAFDHEAMRRRIEETRNRLKAKAFDAMMSGEGALLRESKAEGTEAPTLTVDSDVDETVESALTEEDF